jgi:hypothetical protein
MPLDAAAIDTDRLHQFYQPGAQVILPNTANESRWRTQLC